MATTKKVVKKSTVDKPSKPLTKADILKKVNDLREEAAVLKRNMHMGDVQNVRAYKYKRKEIARALTQLNNMKPQEEK
ncbi:MAG: 50S ribosomal protein L29 [Candidatus Saccharibacteria bacterium]